MDKKSSHAILPYEGEIEKRGSKFYFQIEGRHFSVHIWDVEKLPLKNKSKARGLIFKFSKPIVEHQVHVYGWVYPGTLELLEQS